MTKFEIGRILFYALLWKPNIIYLIDFLLVFFTLTKVPKNKVVPRFFFIVKTLEYPTIDVFVFPLEKQVGWQGLFLNEIFLYIPICLLLEIIHRCLLIYNVDIFESPFRVVLNLFWFSGIICILLTLTFRIL